MENLIERIIRGENLDEVYDTVRRNVFINGPVDKTDLEILSYLCEYDRERFNRKIDSILGDMALFYKLQNEIQASSLESVIINEAKRTILDEFKQLLSPVQADIFNAVLYNNCYSFSAPTSTGKSYGEPGDGYLFHE